MYMHQFKTYANNNLELKVGKRYQVLGYHVGNFVGICTEVGAHSATFKVCEKGSLQSGQTVEVFLASASGAKARIEAI